MSDQYLGFKASEARHRGRVDASQLECVEFNYRRLYFHVDLQRKKLSRPKSFKRLVIVVHLQKHSLPTPEFHGSNPVIGKFYK